MTTTSIVIVGAGPVGALTAIYLMQKGYHVSIYEKLSNPLEAKAYKGRSINLALSHRGVHALEKAGVSQEVLKDAISMKGRMIHGIDGKLQFQPYGEDGQYIQSISRVALTKALIKLALSKYEVPIYFNQKNIDVSFLEKEITFEDAQTKTTKTVSYDVLIGADGAFSSVRKAMEKSLGSETNVEKLTYGYIELTIDADALSGFKMEQHALHIWPREEFMLIALPNADGSFTCTLFLPYEGEHAFEHLTSKEAVHDFFLTFFPDAYSLMNQVEEQFFLTPISGLSTVHTFPWVHEAQTLLIGDAAHAIVPFYGQGMNAGFEDARILSELIDSHQQDWGKVMTAYQAQRKPDGDAIAALALQNFVEMRDLVNDKKFQLRKKIEAKLHSRYKAYLPLYSMVTFSDLPYSVAYDKGKEYDKLMETVLNSVAIENDWQTEEGWKKIETVLTENPIFKALLAT